MRCMDAVVNIVFKAIKSSAFSYLWNKHDVYSEHCACYDDNGEEAIEQIQIIVNDKEDDGPQDTEQSHVVYTHAYQLGVIQCL